ncbi:hypothetical protein ACIBQ2_22785 [Micromonospora sediminimaris]|uniref:Uncharacterized protein n=2 Tax=Micromonospora TaxID=1873 RepID=A0A9W5UWL0_9ACTN|nr:hypothetical protein [Micromonospora sediminimaris]GIJ36406.1 hypothetical protein Vse01_55540 [Micromonospora sediminimaris]SFD78873.1 hypothetical protein SAMN05216284_12614 [Micromonospora sediminimaris]
MLPPRCHVCHLEPAQSPLGDARSDFVLVYFADAVNPPPGWVGHPAGAVWFCGEHASLGEEREHLGSDTALRDIDAVLGRLPGRLSKTDR